MRSARFRKEVGCVERAGKHRAFIDVSRRRALTHHGCNVHARFWCVGTRRTADGNGERGDVLRPKLV